jgi:hypothetical protein
MRNTVIYQRNLGIQSAFCHMNLERCNAKYGNVSEEFRNTERILSQEFADVGRNSVMCQRNLVIRNSVCHTNLGTCNTKYCDVSEEFRNTERISSQEFSEV